jgi:predicted nuclease of predicted toxin-antitoxin system
VTLPIYMDENVHGAITNGLRQRGIDVLTVQEDGRSGIPDSVVLDRAISLSRILFSQDDDLLAEANQRQRAGTFFPGVIFARQTKVSIGTCIRDLELISTLGELSEFKDSVLFLPL